MDGPFQPWKPTLSILILFSEATRDIFLTSFRRLPPFDFIIRQSEMNLGPYVDDKVNLSSQATSYPSTATSLSLAASVCDPGPSPPESSYVLFDSPSTDGSYCFDLTPLSLAADKLESIPIEAESEHMSCSDSFLDTRIKQRPFGVVEGNNVGSTMVFMHQLDHWCRQTNFRCQDVPSRQSMKPPLSTVFQLRAPLTLRLL